MLDAHQTFAYGFSRIRKSASTAVQNLIEHGFDTEQIGVLACEKKRAAHETPSWTTRLESDPGPRLAQYWGLRQVQPHCPWLV
ncbi:MAG TPA: hypothetical protein VJV78_06420 [Polyangiales bacterium]|nr:hypothetical protein [Polyangiales bacterium]